jgi:Glycogen recognition site of AMP-activated protein kinase/Domain of unknown function (DUF3471)
MNDVIKILKLAIGNHLVLGLFLVLGVFGHGASQSQSTTTSDPSPQTPAEKRINPESLKKYIGRYELEVGLIPISTLDVTLENNELWLKPSTVKKRKLLHKAKTIFLDEIAGTLWTFNKDVEGKIVSLSFEYEGANYVAQKVTLPSPTLKGNTTFRLKGYPKANFVILSGTFNNWNQSQFVFGREGDEWVCRIDLSPGKYAYKFIVDGNWILDPANSESEEDEAGNVNSVLVIQNKDP